MKNLCYSRNMFGDKPTQKMAQKSLPILISRGQNEDTILLRELAGEVASHLTRFNFSMRWTLAWIQTTLRELERSDGWNYGEIPCITAIVLASPEQPTNNMAERSRIESGLNTPLPWEDYKRHHILPVFEYPHWDQVIEILL